MPCDHLQHTDARGEALGEPTAANAPDKRTGGFFFLRVLQVKRRADERTRTADLLITSEIWVPLPKPKSRLHTEKSVRGVSLCCAK
jgi:hypothetical protein